MTILHQIISLVPLEQLKYIKNIPQCKYVYHIFLKKIYRNVSKRFANYIFEPSS